MSGRYAEGTTVPIERSRAEIERLVLRYGATHFASAFHPGGAAIQFTAGDRSVRFTLPLPDKGEAKAALQKKRNMRWQGPTDAEINDWLNAEQRRRWRCLLLAIKSKLEVVETGIESFEHAFFANIVTDNGQTVYERIVSDEQMRLLGPVSS